MTVGDLPKTRLNQPIDAVCIAQRIAIRTLQVEMGTVRAEPDADDGMGGKVRQHRRDCRLRSLVNDQWIVDRDLASRGIKHSRLYECCHSGIGFVAGSTA